MMRTRSSLALVVFLLLHVASTAAFATPEGVPPVLLILDASGSMWGQIDGENKIVIARRALGGLVDQLPEDSPAGLIAYGHRSEGDCDDIETVVPLGPLSKDSLKKTVDGLNPKGKTPITRSVQQAFEALKDREDGATVILVSDGLETCGGDPCAAVRAAKEQGIEFILHVVGFDVAGEDVSQLECAAQAGDGMFLSAENADELGQALDRAVAMPADAPAGKLVVKAVADGGLHDVAVSVTHSETGEQAAVSRTYAKPDTNPRSIPLPDGRFSVKVQATGLKGDIVRRFEIGITDGSTVEKEVDFSTGEITIGVKLNDDLGDAVYRVYVAGTREVVAQGRTYTKDASNPATVRITAGSYDVEVGSVQISGRPEHAFGRIEVEPRGHVELAHKFASGELSVGARKGGELVDATVAVLSGESGKEVGRGRTYTKDTTNPKTFVLAPGSYRIRGKAVRLEGKPTKELEVTVEEGKSAEYTLDFGS